MPLSHGLIDNVSLAFPDMPTGMEKVSIAHITDLHVIRPNRGRWQRLIRQLAGIRLDLVLLTGDYQARDRDCRAAMEVLTQLCNEVKPVHGFYGVFGNHDSSELVSAAASLPVTWLINDAVDVEGLPLRIGGFHTTCHRAGWDAIPVAKAMDALQQKALARDKRLKRKEQKDAPAGKLEPAVSISPGASAAQPRAAAIAAAPPPPDDRTVVHLKRMKIALAHYPTVLPIAADLGFDLLVSGHSHGGQIRLPFAKALINSMDWPLRLTSGILRHRQTLCVISRGLGENGLPLRMFCPPHIPLISFKRGPTPGMPTDDVQMLQPW